MKAWGGRTRHIQVQYLWLQEKVREDKLKVIKVDTKMNIADLMTKFLGNEDRRKFMEIMGMKIVDEVVMRAGSPAPDVADGTRVRVAPPLSTGDWGNVSKRLQASLLTRGLRLAGRDCNRGGVREYVSIQTSYLCPSTNTKIELPSYTHPVLSGI